MFLQLLQTRRHESRCNFGLGSALRSFMRACMCAAQPGAGRGIGWSLRARERSAERLFREQCAMPTPCLCACSV